MSDLALRICTSSSLLGKHDCLQAPALLSGFRPHQENENSSFHL